jgi:hypothetical protein
MDTKHILTCETREELECIENALDVYKLWLINQIDNFGTDSNLIDDYNKTIGLVNNMIKSFY